jgi:hypothetical protein
MRLVIFEPLQHVRIEDAVRVDHEQHEVVQPGV